MDRCRRIVAHRLKISTTSAIARGHSFAAAARVKCRYAVGSCSCGTFQIKLPENIEGHFLQEAKR